MIQFATLLIALATFSAIYLFLKGHPDWSRGADGKVFSAPGWWKPILAVWLLILLLFVGYAAAEHGFKLGMLLVFPILGGLGALGLLLLKVVARRADR
jgi:hypothetical protein